MERKLLEKYIMGQTSDEEGDAIVEWLKADPKNHDELNSLWFVNTASILNSPRPTMKRRLPFKMPWYKKPIVRRCMQTAAALLLIAGGWGASQTVGIGKITRQYQAIAAPAGQRINITLQDGTTVYLNSGAKLEYPARFNKNRRVKLSGEAMFDVEHDAQHPFIVETFACDVEVLGTKFNVTADEQTHDFTTALLRGKVLITNKLAANDDRIILDPNEKVSLSGNHLELSQIENTDDYLWTEGILNLAGHPFDDILTRMGKAYGVKIQIDTDKIPEIDIIHGKVPIAMGLDYALRTLQEITPFRYEKDDNNIIHIR